MLKSIHGLAFTPLSSVFSHNFLLQLFGDAMMPRMHSTPLALAVDRDSDSDSERLA